MAAGNSTHPLSGLGQAAPSTLASPSTPPPEQWQTNWATSLPHLERISRQLKPRLDIRVMRSSQLDAARLDEELSSMLREQFLKAFALFRPAAVARLQPELSLLLDFLIFRFSIWEGQPLPGMSLMNLRYRNEAAVQPPSRTASPQASSFPSGSAPSSGSSSSGSTTGPPDLCIAGGHSGVEGPGLSAAQRSLYCLGAVMMRYAWSRLTHHAATRHWGDESGAAWQQRGWALMRRGESAYRLASLLNFLAFLRSGRYRSLLDRLLRARLVYRQPVAARAISFEYLNRQLVWSELSELLLFLLPLVNVKAIKHTLRSYLPRLPMLIGGSSAAAALSGQQQQQGQRQSQHQPCGICSTIDILEPFAAVPCGHRFCYYCLRSQCLADPHYACPLCLRRVDAMQRGSINVPKAGEGTNVGGGEASSEGSGEGSGGIEASELSLGSWLAGRTLSR